MIGDSWLFGWAGVHGGLRRHFILLPVLKVCELPSSSAASKAPEPASAPAGGHERASASRAPATPAEAHAAASATETPAPAVVT